MKKRVFNICALLINFAIVIFTIDAISYNFRSDILRDPEWFGFTGIKCLRFFTNLSNIFVAIVAAIIVVFTVRNIVKDKYDFPQWLINLKFVATTAVSLTFLTVAIFLAPLFAMNGKGYFTLFMHNNFLLHFLSPVLAIISFVFFERRDKIKFNTTILAIIPTILYAIVYTIMVVFVKPENGGWPDFYGFTFGGRMWAAPISAIAVLLVTFAIAALLRFSHNKFVNKISIEDNQNP